jgi:hypothetical protein
VCRTTPGYRCCNGCKTALLDCLSWTSWKQSHLGLSTGSPVCMGQRKHEHWQSSVHCARSVCYYKRQMRGQKRRDRNCRWNASHVTRCICCEMRQVCIPTANDSFHLVDGGESSFRNVVLTRATRRYIPEVAFFIILQVEASDLT